MMLLKLLFPALLGCFILGCVGNDASIAAEPVRCIDHSINLSFVKGKVGNVELTFLLDSGAGFRRAAVRKLPKLLFEEIGDGVKMHAI